MLHPQKRDGHQSTPVQVVVFAACCLAPHIRDDYMEAFALCSEAGGIVQQLWVTRTM